MQFFNLGNFFIITLIFTKYCSPKFVLFVNTLNAVSEYTKEELDDNLSDISLFSQELVRSLSVHLKKIPLSLLKEKVKTQLSRAAQSLDLPNPEDDECEINYSELCPVNWINLGDGESCLSPYDYFGPCKKRVSFRNATSLTKQKFSIKCNVTWSCINKCVEDFSQPCPKKWKLNTNGFCEAPKNYDGKCIRKKNFENYSSEEKKHWGKECNVFWPCYKKNYDFHFLCPINWSTNPDQKSCSAPDSYVGPCPSVLYLFDIKETEKKELMEKCNIEWPVHQNKATYDFKKSICPIGWRISDMQNEVCVAPDTYNGPCEKTISFSNFSNEEKYDFSKKCDVQWKTLDEKYQNYDLSCPYNWKLIDKEEILCMAPKEYNGACDTIFSFKNYSKEMKAAWASACGTIFASGELTDLMEGGKMKRTRKKIFGKMKEDNTVPPSIHSGPIGSIGTQYEGQVLPADDETIYAPSNETRNKYPYDGTIHLDNIGKMSTSDFVVSDDKIKDLMLLKASSDDEQFRATVEETIQQLKRKYHTGHFSFIEINASEEKMETTVDQKKVDKEHTHNTIEKEAIDAVKNMYENYKIDNDKFSYSDSCIEKDYTKCPIGWSTINNNQCLAPKAYIRNTKKCPPVLNIGSFVKSVYDVSHDIIFDTLDIEARKKLEITCNLTFPCKECERDYVKINCPIGWTELDNGDCQAPVDYPDSLKKKCGIIVNFAFATPIIKKNWSLLCKSTWPCVSACEKNYGAICPVGYKLINERTESSGTEERHIYVCANENWNLPLNMSEKENTDDRNQCHVIEVFNSPNLKKEIENKCNVIWPCLNKCEENFYQTCPYNWLLKDNRCIAPYYYNPPKGCNTSFDVLSFSSIDKSYYSSKCFASWPCKNACQQDYTVHCPAEWKMQKIVKGGKRKNDETSTLENDKKTAGKKEKKMGENVSGVRYFCVAPDHYKGPCHRQQDLTDFTFLQKQDFSFRCNVRWPCGYALYQTENWQNESAYTDINFKKLKTLRFYDFAYAEMYTKYKNSFFNFQ